MKRVAVVLLFVARGVMAAGCPTAAPNNSQFHLQGPACVAASPCLNTQAITLSLEKNLSCYPSWLPCPGYTIQACDKVTWDFGDGTAPVSVTGKKSITHTFAPGHHTVKATVTNAKGSATVVRDLHIGMAPASFVKFEKTAYTYGEADGAATVRVVRSGDLSRSVPITYWVSALSLMPARGTIVFGPGEKTKDLSFTIVNDTVRHFWYPASVIIENETGEAILTNGYMASADVTIVEDDASVTVTPVLAQRSYVEGNGTTIIRVGVKLSAAQSEVVRLRYSTWDVKSTAKAGADYEGVIDDVVIPAGQTMGYFDIVLYGDGMAEKQETLVLYLGISDTNFSVYPEISGWPVTITIVDDDSGSAVEARFNPSTLAVNTGDRPWPWFATRAAATNRVVRFKSSNPDVAWVPDEATILANSEVTRIPVHPRKYGTALITGTLPNGLSATLTVSVDGATAPALPQVYFAPATASVAQGGKTRVTFHAGNTAAAPRVLTLGAANAGLIGVPGSVTIPAGADRVDVDINGVKSGSTALTGTIADGRATTMNVTVSAPAATLVAPASVTVKLGQKRSLSYALQPARAATVTFTVVPAGSLAVPSSLALGSTGRGTVQVKGLRIGTFDLIANTTGPGGAAITSTTKVTVTK